MNKYLIILLLFVSISLAGHLAVNGDFEESLNIGWSTAFGLQSSLDTIDRQTYYDADPDYEVRVKKYDEKFAKLYQTIDIPTTDLEFSINAKLYALEYGTSASYWAAAAICLRYLDANGAQLGETRIAHKSTHCPWTNTNTIHLITVTDPNNWHAYNFNIATELTNLPLVNGNNIRKIQIALLDTTNGC
jgi:hypothetical protein